MHAVQAGKALAYLTDYSTLQYYQTTLNCKLQVLATSQQIAANDHAPRAQWELVHIISHLGSCMPLS